MSSHISIRHPGKFPRQFLPPAFFLYKHKMSAFVTGKCRLKVKSAWGDLTGWHQNGVFSNMRIEKNGTSFHESWTSRWERIKIMYVIIPYVIEQELPVIPNGEDFQQIRAFTSICITNTFASVLHRIFDSPVRTINITKRI